MPQSKMTKQILTFVVGIAVGLSGANGTRLSSIFAAVLLQMRSQLRLCVRVLTAPIKSVTTSQKQKKKLR